MSEIKKKVLIAVFMSFAMGAAIIWGGKSTEVKTVNKMNDELIFDSKTCNRGGDGNIYLALDHIVFRVKMDDDFSPTSIQRLSKENTTKLPEPLDATQPEGCYEHPAQVLSFAVSKVGVFSILNQHSNHLHYEEYFARMLSDTVGGKTTCLPDDQVKSFIVCRSFSRDSRGDPTRTMYKADEQFYTTPNGNPFLVYCDYIPTGNCNITYDIQDKFQLRIRFDIDRTPISDVIYIDKIRREKYQTMIVENYPWKK